MVAELALKLKLTCPVFHISGSSSRLRES